MSDKKTLSKQKVEIVNHELDVPYSKGAKYLDRIQAKNLSLPEGDPLFDKPLRMTIFKQDLKTFIRGKTAVIIDIEETERLETEYGPDRTVVQAYDEKGEPVSTKQPGGFGGGNRRSLEDDLALQSVINRSAEGIAAMNQVGALLLCDRPLDKETCLTFGEDTGLGITEEELLRIVGKYWRIVEKSLDAYLDGNPVAKRADKPQDKKPEGKKTDKVSNNKQSSTDPIQHVGDLLNRSLKLDPPVTKAEIVELCSVNDPSEIKDLEGAWKKAQELSLSKRA